MRKICREGAGAEFVGSRIGGFSQMRLHVEGWSRRAFRWGARYSFLLCNDDSRDRSFWPSCSYLSPTLFQQLSITSPFHHQDLPIEFQRLSDILLHLFFAFRESFPTLCETLSRTISTVCESYAPCFRMKSNGGCQGNRKISPYSALS